MSPLKIEKVPVNDQMLFRTPPEPVILRGDLNMYGDAPFEITNALGSDFKDIIKKIEVGALDVRIHLLDPVDRDLNKCYLVSSTKHRQVISRTKIFGGIVQLDDESAELRVFPEEARKIGYGYRFSFVAP